MPGERGPFIVGIEAGHLYEPAERLFYNVPGEQVLTDEVGAPMVLRGIQLGLRLVDAFNATGIQTKQYTFIDDTALTDHFVQRLGDPHGDLAIRAAIYRGLTGRGYDKAGWRGETYREGSLKPQAEKVIAQLQTAIEESAGYRLSIDRRKVKMTQRGKTSTIKLLGKWTFDSTNPDYPSCEVLDMCMYMRKLSEADVAVTVLPLSYEEQQNRVRQLFTILGQTPNVVIVYFDDEGAIGKIDAWSEKGQPIVEVLQSVA